LEEIEQQQNMNSGENTLQCNRARRKRILLAVVPAVLLCLSANAAEFDAYYTRLDRLSGSDAGKYQDLVVMLGRTNRLEFARANGYLPQWRTAGGVHPVENLFPDSDKDPNCYYNYVRLIQNGPDRIVVHWRYFRDIASIIKANEELDSLNPHGITGVIHELFTIYPDGKIEREVRDAANTRYQDWIDPRLATRQNVKLTDTGIEHGPVKAGQKPPFLPRPAVKGNLVMTGKGLPGPVHHWSFDDGMKPHGDRVKESVSGTDCELSGLMTQFKKGVSGTALALDGYYSGVSMESGSVSHENLTVEAWVALDAYPYNTAPLIHHSKDFGREGWYLGLDAYGHPLIKVTGHAVKAVNTVLPLYKWTQVCATIGSNRICLYVDGREVASDDFNGAMKTPKASIFLGRNSEPERCTDSVRGPQRNLEFIYGIQGLLDEVSIYDKVISAGQVKQAYDSLCPADRSSDLARGVLPGEPGAVKQFGATYKTLAFSDVWDQLWRELPGAEIVVKFDRNPCSVIYWRGCNYAPSWVVDNNRWMADQSSEIGGRHGCSEHMADKQIRHSHARIIANTPARVVIHWRYPCVDVSYQNLNPLSWSDEYHTIYPDGTGVRHVVWNGTGGVPGFQDIQFLTNPGETALDVMNLQAMTLANLKGETRELTWDPERRVPGNPMEDACIEVLNSRSVHKVFAMFQGGYIKPWGAGEQSKYTADPFAGPWNHWPMHLVPSDGRFAVAADRVTHFAIGANDAVTKFGSIVHYGFTDKPIAALVPKARFWQKPPRLKDVAGAESMGFNKNDKSYCLKMQNSKTAFVIDATKDSPVVNPCFVLTGWGEKKEVTVKINGKIVKKGDIYREGSERDDTGNLSKVLWLEMNHERPVTVEIGKQ